MLNRRVVRALKKLQLDTYVKDSVLPLILGEYSSKKREQQQEARTVATATARIVARTAVRIVARIVVRIVAIVLY